MNVITPEEMERDAGALLDRVETGERLIVVRDGQPVAELRPVSAARCEPRPFGLCAGQFAVPEDFDAPLPEEILRDSKGP